MTVDWTTYIWPVVPTDWLLGSKECLNRKQPKRISQERYNQEETPCTFYDLISETMCCYLHHSLLVEES